MTPLALAFLIASWTGVLGLTAWCFYRVLRAGRRGGPGDGPDDGEAT
jgi:hypothetical protein